MGDNNAWSAILAGADLDANDSPSASSSSHNAVLLVLGDPGAGKSALAAHLQRSGGDQGVSLEHRPAMALDYAYLDMVRTPSLMSTSATNKVQNGTENSVSGSSDGLVDSRRVSLWQLQGEAESAPCLLRFAVKPEDLLHATVLVVLDGSRPWSLIEQLRRWLGVVETHLASLLPRLQSGELDFAKSRVEGEFLATKKLRPTAVGANNASQNTLLENNLGVRVVVALAKADVLDAQERLRGFDDPHFLWIHAHLRRVCLDYGASLVYCSCKTGTNVSTLRDLLAARILRETPAFPNTAPAPVALPSSLLRSNFEEREAVFVPAGLDERAQISVDIAEAAKLLGVDPDIDFEDVIKGPGSSSLSATNAAEEVSVVALDDTAFLQELHEEQLRQPLATAAIAAMTTTMAVTPSTPKSSAVVTAPTAVTPATPLSFSGIGAGATSQPTSAGVTPVRAPPPHGGASSAASSPALGTTDHGALSSFFKNLVTQGSKK